MLLRLDTYCLHLYIFNMKSVETLFSWKSVFLQRGREEEGVSMDWNILLVGEGKWRLEREALLNHNE